MRHSVHAHIWYIHLWNYYLISHVDRRSSLILRKCLLAFTTNLLIAPEECWFFRRQLFSLDLFRLSYTAHILELVEKVIFRLLPKIKKKIGLITIEWTENISGSSTNQTILKSIFQVNVIQLETISRNKTKYCPWNLMNWLILTIITAHNATKMFSNNEITTINLISLAFFTTNNAMLWFKNLATGEWKNQIEAAKNIKRNCSENVNLWTMTFTGWLKSPHLYICTWINPFFALKSVFIAINFCVFFLFFVVSQQSK